MPALHDLGHEDHQREGRPLPGLEPGREQPGGRGPPEPARPAAASTALVGQQPERHQPHRDGGEEVAPEIGAGPQLAADEVEVELRARRSDVTPAHDRRHGRGREQREHQRQDAVGRALDEAAHVEERAGEQRRHRHRLPHHVGGDDAEPRAVEQPRDHHSGVHERVRPGREVVQVRHRDVMAGLAQPVEVLELVHHQVAVRAGDEPAVDPDAHEQPGQHGHRQGEERGEDEQIGAREARGRGAQEGSAGSGTSRSGGLAWRAASWLTWRRAATSSRTTGTSTRRIDRRDPGRSAQWMPTSRIR